MTQSEQEMTQSEQKKPKVNKQNGLFCEKTTVCSFCSLFSNTFKEKIKNKKSKIIYDKSEQSEQSEHFASNPSFFVKKGRFCSFCLVPFSLFV